jgi:predicted adenylyl cyclase CyaB
MKRNIELKARCADLAAKRAAALVMGAVPAAVLHQIDTYFIVPHGRLKLREINQERAELIQYHREDQAEFRASNYRVVPVSDAGQMKAALIAALGLRGEVRKRRELLMYHNVRIHLDEVAGLGTFIEYEAVISPEAGEEITRRRLEELQRGMKIDRASYLARSYSDLMGL